MKRRMTTVWRNGCFVLPQGLQPGQMALLGLMLGSGNQRACAPFCPEEQSARDADKVGAQLRARAYGVSRRSVADKGRVERLAGCG